MFDYRAEFFHWYQAVLDAGVAADVVGKDDEWKKYEFLMFPVTYMVDRETGEKVKHYVENGGKLIVTYGSGISDSCDHVYLGGYPGAFREVLGIRVEEFTAVDENRVVMLSNDWSGELWADDKALVGQPIVTRRRSSHIRMRWNSLRMS